MAVHNLPRTAILQLVGNDVRIHLTVIKNTTFENVKISRRLYLLLSKTPLQRNLCA